MTKFSSIKKTYLILKITIVENIVRLFLIDNRKKIIAESEWKDNRNLSEKLLGKIDKLLKRNNLTIKNISKVDFNCDSPYFKLEGDTSTCRLLKLYSKDLSSKSKCGFMAWQTGEITTKVLSFIIYN